MNGIGEAMGTAAEGGLYADATAKTVSASEPSVDSDGHFQESNCLNCGTRLIGEHCHQCGQPAHLHRSLGALWHDIAHGVLHMEGKTWHTLPMLAWKPGELTRRYIQGERAKFVSPMALFLFSVFLMFAAFQALGIGPPTDLTTTDGFRQDLAEIRQETVERRRNTREKLERMAVGDPDRPKTERTLQELDEAIEGFTIASASIARGSPNAENTITTDIPFIDHGIEKWNKNPGLMLYKLQNNSYKFSWLLIPLSIPFMWMLFFWKRGVRAYDHAIFVTYSLAFMSLLFVTISILAAFGTAEWILTTAATAIPTFHLYRQLRGAYGLRRRSAIWRLVVLSVLIGVVLMLFVNILLVLGAL